MNALPEIGKVVNIIAPQIGQAITGDYVSLKNYHKAYFIFQYRGSGNPATVDIHLYASLAVGGVDVVDQALVNWWRLSATTAGFLLTDTLTKGAAAVTLVTSTANQDELVVIEVNPEDYPLYDCFTIHADASNGGNWQSCVAVLVPGRYQQATPPSAIID
jgi:hypothetical protein